MPGECVGISNPRTLCWRGRSLVAEPAVDSFPRNYFFRIKVNMSSAAGCSAPDRHRQSFDQGLANFSSVGNYIADLVQRIPRRREFRKLNRTQVQGFGSKCCLNSFSISPSRRFKSSFSPQRPMGTLRHIYPPRTTPRDLFDRLMIGPSLSHFQASRPLDPGGSHRGRHPRANIVSKKRQR